MCMLLGNIPTIDQNQRPICPLKIDNTQPFLNQTRAKSNNLISEIKFGLKKIGVFCFHSKEFQLGINQKWDIISHDSVLKM